MTKLSTMAVFDAVDLVDTVRFYGYDPNELLPINRSKAVLLRDLRVLVNGYRLTAFAVYNPPSVAAGAITATTINVVGAVLGDFAKASFSIALGGLLLVSAEVTAAGIVTVTFWNPTGAPIDIGSGTLRCTVEPHS